VRAVDTYTVLLDDNLIVIGHESVDWIQLTQVPLAGFFKLCDGLSTVITCTSFLMMSVTMSANFSIKTL
jgi:hypothetical protein